MVAHVTTVSFKGLQVTPVDVQVQLVTAMPAFSIVGLPDKAVAESKERVRSAITSMGLTLPNNKRIIVNLAPADLAKVGSHYDLPIALGILVAMGNISQEEVADYYVVGELSLDSSLLPVTGVLPAAIDASANQMRGIICPAKSGPEAAWAGDIDIIAAPSLIAIINHFKGTQILPKPELEVDNTPLKLPDLADIKGQQHAKRALEIAAAGSHNMLLTGPPGSGKSMLASRLTSILPPLTSKEVLDVSMISSMAGMITDGKLSTTRPYRTPHHSVSMVAMVGGGKRAFPGEVSLAHKGVLFLDELPEFNRDVLESLRQPIETGNITIARANSHVTYPARFQLICAMNPCRCGYIDDANRACNKVPRCAMDYQSRISGPIYDRFDLFIQVGALKPSDMMSTEIGESSATVRARVIAARELQETRYKALNQAYTSNNEAEGEVLNEACKLDKKATEILSKAVEKFNISMRGYNRILRVARTIADLSAAKDVNADNITEAISYRRDVYR